MLKNKLLIIGAGGHGRVVAEAAELSGDWQDICFLDDSFLSIKKCWKWDVVGTVSDLRNLSRHFECAVVAIGNQNTRERLFKELLQNNMKIETIVHPSALISSGAIIGHGSVVLAGVIIGPQTNIGMGSIVNIGSVIDHDVMIGDFVHIGVGVKIAGGTVIGERSWLQTGVVVNVGGFIESNMIVPPGKILFTL